MLAPATDFLTNFIHFQRDAPVYNIPDPTIILDVLDLSSHTTSAWGHTDPKFGNKWRARAAGSPIVSSSDPQEKSDRKNIISASFRPQILHLRLKCSMASSNSWKHLMEPVLIIPEVLALLGDNPMQSEFACHLGLRGKLFRQACWVKGHDTLDPRGPDQPHPNNTADDTIPSAFLGRREGAYEQNN
ncbi:hypothetical protein B0H14DRAFT_2559667 [Mycena olivaceomarginata]|nr:hypothetical protein B0H14DRAFT_2559667 [Mycena olivaceomarginata]